jgi:hypothetical protein
MAASINTTSRFHNPSDAALADEIGRVDAIMKSADAELKTLKDEFKARGLTAANGDNFAVTSTEQIAGRLDAKSLKAFLGDAYVKFETAVVSTVVRIKPAVRPLDVALAA